MSLYGNLYHMTGVFSPHVTVRGRVNVGRLCNNVCVQHESGLKGYPFVLVETSMEVPLPTDTCYSMGIFGLFFQSPCS